MLSWWEYDNHRCDNVVVVQKNKDVILKLVNHYYHQFKSTLCVFICIGKIYIRHS